MTKVAIIPARGGSTRLPKKNCLLLCGKPLIRWITETVVNSNEFDSVYISTDSDEIFECVKDLQVKRHIRPDHLATTQATVLSAMIDVMENIPYHDIFAYFLPTCPFIQGKYIKEGIGMLNSDIDSVVSVSYYDEPIQLACVKQIDNTIVPMFDNLTAGLTNSKYIQKYVKPNGGFYISHWDKIKENKNFFKGNVKGVLIPNDILVDIDYAHDFKMAEIMWREVLNKDSN
jgi:CMP-N,N'-diacetyllegionaminic acid synthase